MADDMTNELCADDFRTAGIAWSDKNVADRRLVNAWAIKMILSYTLHEINRGPNMKQNRINHGNFINLYFARVDIAFPFCFLIA